MHFYSLDFERVLLLPIRVFWLLSNNIQRIQARNDLRSLNVYSATQLSVNGSTELLNSVREQLLEERGDTIKLKFDPIKERLDRTGLETLRRMSEKGR